MTPNIDSAIEHIAVAQSIDALIVAPATADVWHTSRRASPAIS